jgi:hypothetical protein
MKLSEPFDIRGVAISRRNGYAIRYGTYLLAAFLTCAVALYNEFPLTYPDTGTYIANARDVVGGFLGGAQPSFFDRPLTYGLFLVPFASSYTLWLVPLAQGFLVAFAVDLTLRSVSISLSTSGFLALFAGLSTFTSLPFFSGQVMPDIFTSLVILLSFVTLWGSERLSQREQWAAGSLLIFAIASHLSHLPLYAALVVLGLLARMIVERTPALWSRFAPIVLRATAPLVVAVGLVIAPNYLMHGELVLSRSTDLFYLAQLVGQGLAQRYLDHVCLSRHYLLCSERSQLRADTDWFLWSSSGPRKRYEANSQRVYSTFLREAHAIVYGTLRQEWPALIRRSLPNAVTQLTNIGVHPGDHRFSPTVERAMKRLGLVESYRASRQVQGTVPDKAASLVQYTSVVLGLLLVLGYLPLLRGPAHRELRWLIATVYTGLVLNAFVLSNLAVAHTRYQSRVVWLIPLLGVLAAIGVVREHGRHLTGKPERHRSRTISEQRPGSLALRGRAAG